MANIEKKQSEIEKAVNEAYKIFKCSLQSALAVDNLAVSVDVVGVKLSTLALMTEENEMLELNVIEDSGMLKDTTRYYIELGGISLENRKTN